MIYGIGIDIINEDRIKPLMDDESDPFFLKTYTESERKEAASRDDRLRYYAERFAAKEALFKAMRPSADGVRLDMIETLDDQIGVPEITLYGELEKRRVDLGIDAMHVSLSNDGATSVAVVICEIHD